jgi:hypothetical protein
MNQNHDESRKVSFSDFVFLQSQQALMSLGQFPNPMTGKYEENLFVAQYVIDILSMLREKTKGNLDENEAKLLENVLHELRMTYVEKAQEAGKKGTAKPEGAEEAAPEGKAPEPDTPEADEPGKEEASGASGTWQAGGKKMSTMDVSPPDDSDGETEERIIQMPPPSDEEIREDTDKGS